MCYVAIATTNFPQLMSTFFNYRIRNILEKTENTKVLNSLAIIKKKKQEVLSFFVFIQPLIQFNSAGN